MSTVFEPGVLYRPIYVFDSDLSTYSLYVIWGCSSNILCNDLGLNLVILCPGGVPKLLRQFLGKSISRQNETVT